MLHPLGRSANIAGNFMVRCWWRRVSSRGVGFGLPPFQRLCGPRLPFLPPLLAFGAAATGVSGDAAGAEVSAGVAGAGVAGGAAEVSAGVAGATSSASNPGSGAALGDAFGRAVGAAVSGKRSRASMAVE